MGDQHGYVTLPAIDAGFRDYLADFRARPDDFPLRTESGRIVLGSARLEALFFPV